jgi:hypothetical protein
MLMQMAAGHIVLDRDEGARGIREVVEQDLDSEIGE